ncbi:hypothetical protein, partial [Pseudomonas vlassakiae]
AGFRVRAAKCLPQQGSRQLLEIEQDSCSYICFGPVIPVPLARAPWGMAGVWWSNSSDSFDIEEDKQGEQW